MSVAFASPEIEGLDGASVFVEESLENAERPAELKECTLCIQRDGAAQRSIRLGPTAARELAAALLECFKLVPGAVTK